MPWPWPPLHHVFRAFDHLSPSQARVEAARMLDGFRKELAVEAVVFGMMVTGLVGVVPCGAMLVVRINGSGWVHPVFPLLLLTAVAVGYVAGSWRWQRVAAVVLESRLRAGGDRVWNVCAECRYSLNGLPHDDGRVVCPECGHVQIGADWRDSAESIASKTAGTTGATPDSAKGRHSRDA